jgi:hypothetical protein
MKFREGICISTVFSLKLKCYHCSLFMLWHIDLLLGNGREISRLQQRDGVFCAVRPDSYIHRMMTQQQRNCVFCEGPCIMHSDAAQNDSSVIINMNTIALLTIIDFCQILIGEIPKQSRITLYYTYLKLKRKVILITGRGGL